MTKFRFLTAALAFAAALCFGIAATPAFAVETTISAAEITTAGTVQTLAAANAGGDKFLVRSDGRTWFTVANASGGDVDVTLVAQTTSISVPGVGTVTIPDIVVTVATGTTVQIGPIAPAYVDSTGYAHVTYESVTSVTAKPYHMSGVN